MPAAHLRRIRGALIETALERLSCGLRGRLRNGEARPKRHYKELLEKVCRSDAGQFVERRFPAKTGAAELKQLRIHGHDLERIDLVARYAPRQDNRPRTHSTRRLTGP